MSYGTLGLTRGGSQQRAFTLIEMVVALSILSLIMLATITGLRTLASTQVAMERVTDRVDQVRTVSTFLRNTFESAILSSKGSRLSAGGPPSGGKNYFKLTKQSVAWKSTVLFGETFGGSYLVRVAREDDTLVLRWQKPSVKGDADNWDDASERVLVTNVEDFVLSYRPEFTAEWTSELDRNVIPVLMRMQIKTSGRYWPDLILRVERSR